MYSLVFAQRKVTRRRCVSSECVVPANAQLCACNLKECDTSKYYTGVTIELRLNIQQGHLSLSSPDCCTSVSVRPLMPAFQHSPGFHPLGRVQSNWVKDTGAVCWCFQGQLFLIFTRVKGPGSAYGGPHLFSGQFRGALM